ncbi:hypothetical protein TNCT_644831 [Trichonephila clavata]|uniref:Uncharacterized protein n=1 Tax=Trichonephila clavata TaxID=2740835 RepID=A0A8X6FJ49_TRICU|nr:hypothetical protein TNCT_644831 [Trichonephila clavata]
MSTFYRNNLYLSNGQHPISLINKYRLEERIYAYIPPREQAFDFRFVRLTNSNLLSARGQVLGFLLQPLSIIESPIVIDYQRSQLAYLFSSYQGFSTLVALIFLSKYFFHRLRKVFARLNASLLIRKDEYDTLPMAKWRRNLDFV